MTIIETISDFIEKVGNIFASFSVSDALDIILVTLIIYGVIKLLRDTRAIQLIKGIVLIGVVYIIIMALDMKASEYLFQSVFSNIVLVLLILFQPEIRHAFESLGRSNITKKIPIIGGNNVIIQDDESVKTAIGEIVKACEEMSEKKIGALMVFERGTLLGEIIQSGTQIDALISQQMLGNIFYPKSPMHDGAIVIRGDRIISAACILPLTTNHDFDKELGTRHRAALGMSEESDALVLVISEETGAVSCASRGELKRDLTSEELGNILHAQILEKGKEDSVWLNKIRKVFGGLIKSDGKDVG